jgi:predicted MFS family arabinose efflux permease
MRPAQLKLGCFCLEAVNSFAATFFLFYLFFLMRDEFGFGPRENLLLTAGHGLIYALASWQGGRFVQRFGAFAALKTGFAGMVVIWAFGAVGSGPLTQILTLLLWTAPLCLTWPALEVLVTDGEDYQGTARMIGRYNVVWAVGSAVAYFSGGWLWEQFGRTGFYGLCVALMMGQLIFTIWFERQAKALLHPSPPGGAAAHQPEVAAGQQSLRPQRFRQLAWFANPFAYMAMNTLGAVIPQLAEKFQLTPTHAGVFCSVWFFVRALAFVGLWKWTGWHYRFRWLLAAFAGLVASFTAILLASHLWLVLLAQVLFGGAVGLIYYSSLFYSMDGGETKGEHGGLHEAAIGLGICVGPAVGAAALWLPLPTPHAGAWAVSGLLTAGLGGLVWLRGRK